MTGAIIPDDWDGVTFECSRIEWPASEKWRAILLGQASEPSQERYWDVDSGDAVAAAIAVQNAYRLTTPVIYTEECDITPGIPVPAFSARATSSQSIPASTWTTVVWESLEWALNNPNFSLALNAHTPINEDLLGLWSYAVSVRPDLETPVWLRAIQQPGNVVQAVIRTDGYNSPLLAFDVPHDAAGDQLRIEVWSLIANSITFIGPSSWFTGHFLGPVSE